MLASQNNFNSGNTDGSQPSMRLRDDPQPVNTTGPRTSRKRKSPPDDEQQQPPPPPNQQPQHVLPPHPLMHQLPPGALPPGYQYVNFDPNGASVMPQGSPSPGEPQSPGSAQAMANGRQLSTSKRAEQNRKAQRAFRERRDQHVKTLESRSQLLETALASADEANRRWEECRALVDQLRVENTALRAAIGAMSMPGPPADEKKEGDLNGSRPDIKESESQ